MYIVDAANVAAIDIDIDLVALEAAERLDSEHYVLTIKERT